MAFTEVDVSQTPEALRQMLLHGGRAAVPTIAIGRDTLVGFDPARIDELLARISPRLGDGPS